MSRQLKLCLQERYHWSRLDYHHPILQHRQSSLPHYLSQVRAYHQTPLHHLFNQWLVFKALRALLRVEPIYKHHLGSWHLSPLHHGLQASSSYLKSSAFQVQVWHFNPSMSELNGHFWQMVPFWPRRTCDLNFWPRLCLRHYRPSLS